MKTNNLGRKGDWIQTYSSRQLWPLDPRPEDVYIEDIAAGLAKESRFAGQTGIETSVFYSVAQHSVLASLYCDPADQWAALFHDAEEYVFKDLPRPLKHDPLMREYRLAARRFKTQAINPRFNLPDVDPPSVKRVDMALLRTEQAQLMKRAPAEWEDNREGALDIEIVPWPPLIAEGMFLQRFITLGGAKFIERFCGVKVA